MEKKHILIYKPKHEKLSKLAYEYNTTILEIVDKILAKELKNWKPTT